VCGWKNRGLHRERSEEVEGLFESKSTIYTFFSLPQPSLSRRNRALLTESFFLFPRLSTSVALCSTAAPVRLLPGLSISLLFLRENLTNFFRLMASFSQSINLRTGSRECSNLSASRSSGTSDLVSPPVQIRTTSCILDMRSLFSPSTSPRS